MPTTRTKSFCIRLTGKELTCLDKQLEKAGITREGFVRTLITVYEPVCIPPRRILSILDSEVFKNKNEETKENTLNGEDWILQKQFEREQAFELSKATAVRVLQTPETTRSYFDLLSRLEGFTMTNSRLIFAQTESATKLFLLHHSYTSKVVSPKSKLEADTVVFTLTMKATKRTKQWH